MSSSVIDPRLSLPAWQRMAERMQLLIPDSVHARVLSAWLERHRHYHTPAHLSACLHRVDQIKDKVKQLGELECALWFHDAVYKPRGHSNELESADWATEVLREAGAEKPQIERVRQMILATAHGEANQALDPNDCDMHYMLDIDLSILGASPPDFDRYERDVRREYWFVMPWTYRSARAKILQNILSRPTIYLSKHFQDRLESQARRNLIRSLDKIG